MGEMHGNPATDFIHLAVQPAEFRLELARVPLHTLDMTVKFLLQAVNSFAETSI
jgi:hypothetical protein